jgi:hypothetical protein
MWKYLDEVIALVIVIGCLILIGLGIDNEVKSILALAAGWAFGSRFVKRGKASS